MPSPESFPAGAPCWIDLFTNDTAASTAFYSGLLGWTAEEASDEFGGYFMFTYDGKPVAGCMPNEDPANPADVWNVYLEVGDIEATAAAATDAGATVIVPPMPIGPIGHMAMVIDPSGAAIGMWQPAEFAGFGLLAEPHSAAWFELHTNGYDAVVPFYTDVFKWEAHTMSDAPEFRYTTLFEDERSAAGIMDATVYAAEGTPSYWAVYFGVDDCDASVAKAVELGATVVDPPADTPYGRLASLTDSTGSAFRLIQAPAA